MDQQLPLFNDNDIQTDGTPRPWRLKWGVIPAEDGDTADTNDTGEEAA